MKKLKQICNIGLAGLTLATPASAGITNKLEQGFTSDNTNQSRLWTIAKSTKHPIKYVGLNQIEDLDSNTYFGKQRLEIGSNIKAIGVATTTKDGIIDTQYGMQLPLPKVLGANYGCIRGTANADTHTLDIFGNWDVPLVEGLTAEGLFSIKPNGTYTELQLEQQLPNDFGLYARVQKPQHNKPTYVIGISKKF